jgi:two-component system chemotaxis response regulator CheB
MTNARTRVVIVDDSSLSRAILRKILEADGDIEVVGEGTNGLEALPKIQEFKPDLVTMDIDMPGANGLETIQRVMQTSPVPILVITSERLDPESDIGFRAIQLGALDFVGKAPITDAASTDALRALVRSLSKVPVFVHAEQEGISTSIEFDEMPMKRSVVAIASGTGGPKPLAAILRTLPTDFACPILVVQHHPDRFSRAFAKFLQSTTSLRVKVVDGLPYEFAPGEVVLCGADAHLMVPRRGVAVASYDAPVAGHRPSATVLLQSVADVYGPSAIGIVLSGNGEDGLEGLAALRRVNALTIAESVSSAVVGDLPRAAIASGSVVREMPYELIADYLVATVSNVSSKTTAPPRLR